MKETEKLLRDINTLRESIKLDWKDLSTLQLTEKERSEIKQHIEWCQNELKDLFARLSTMFYHSLEK